MASGERARRLAATVVMGVAAAGCSPGVVPRRIDAARVEQASPGAAVRGGPVPVVIRPPRPSGTAFAPPSRRPVAPGLLPRGAAGGDGSRAEIEAAIAAYLRDFNRHDVAAVAARWAERAESLDLDSGAATVGRESVRDVFAALFARDGDASIEIDLGSVRPVRHDVAVVDGTSTVTFGDGTRASSRFSAVMVKQRGDWLLDSVREAAVPEAPDPGSRPLDRLAWLVGSWERAGPGGTAVMRCDWTAERAFLVRTHTLPEPAAGAAEGDGDIPALLPASGTADRGVTEIIGWDPAAGLVRSWVFTSDGRFGEGTWVPDGSGWRVRIEGRFGDPARAAEHVVARDGADGLTVVGHGGAWTPVGGFVRSAR